MGGHAITQVDWRNFSRRRRSGIPERSFYHASRKELLLDRVGDGGTLWVMTSRDPERGQARVYHLAYKLVDCRAAERVPPAIQRAYGRNMVVSNAWEASVHYPKNDATEVLRSLEFLDGLKPMARCKSMGTQLLNLPRLTADSIERLETFSVHLLSQRRAFLSYSQRDRTAARALVKGLRAHGIEVVMDADLLRGGDEWEVRLRRTVCACDLFLVLVSRESAKPASFVHREVAWAIDALTQTGLVRRIVPLRMPGRGWEGFGALHAYQAIALAQRRDRAAYADLARQLAVSSARGRGDWE